MKRLTLLSSLLCLPTTLACQGDDLSVGGGASLEREDVENLPAGDAEGSDVSGAYLFSGFDQRACSCRSGNVEQWCATTLAVQGVVLTQDGGALEMRALDMGETSDTLVLAGGIDADGSLLVGGVNPVTDVTGNAIGDTVNQVEGNIQPRDGGDLVWTMRGRAVADGTSVDCSMVFGLTVTWWDPDSIASCGSASDCHPERPYCVEDVCTDGAVGTACVFANDCDSGICVEEACSAGMPGDACDFPSDCLSEACVDGTCAGAEDCSATGCDGGQICFEGACQDGAEGDGCETSLHCAPSFKCTQGTCYDGSEGDPCDSGLGCSGDSPICYMDACQDGSEGDPCEAITECSTEAPACVDGACRDGSPGDPCDLPTDCASLECGADGTCG